MADVLVHNDAAPTPLQAGYRSQVFTSPSVGYQFYVDATSNDLVYKKTIDGGQTWAAAVTVRTGTVTSFDIWYDKWTLGGTGTVIHTWYVDSAAHDVFYRALDVSGDSLGTEATVFNGASATAEATVTGAKARGGNLLCVFDIDAGTETGSYRSIDAGGSWGSRANANEAVQDYYLLFPGNDADNQDMWLIFMDRSANAISLKIYDDSADSWGETAILAMTDVAQSTLGVGFNGAMRHSDGHLILAFFNARDTAGSDLLVYDINGSASVTAKTNVLTDIDDTYNPVVFVNQSNADLYVAFNGTADGSQTIGTSTNTYYVKSTDGGSTWGAPVAISASAYNLRSMHCDLGSANCRFIPVFLDSTNADIYVNYDNSVLVGSDPGAGGGVRHLLLLGVGT